MSGWGGVLTGDYWAAMFDQVLSWVVIMENLDSRPARISTASEAQIWPPPWLPLSFSVMASRKRPMAWPISSTLLQSSVRTFLGMVLVIFIGDAERVEGGVDLEGG